MIRVLPYRIQANKETREARLLLRSSDMTKCLAVSLSIENARQVAAEMHGLSSEQCNQYHLMVALAGAFNARIDAVVLQEIDQTWSVMLRLDKEGGLLHVPVDLGPALAMALHLSLPVFVDGSNALDPEKPVARQALSDLPSNSEIRKVFRDFLGNLDIPIGPGRP